MDDAQAVLGSVQNQMGRNGFVLETGELRHQEGPHPLGVFFEVFKSFLGALAILFFIAGQFIAEAGDDILALAAKYPGLAIVAIALVAVPLIARSVLYFLDLLKREYNVFENMITYTEGFLTKHYAFIPFKNLSDSATTQTLVDRIFGLYDVKLSAQGSGHEILFKNLARGQEISQTLDELIDAYEEPDSSIKPSSVSGSSEKPALRDSQASSDRLYHASLDTEYTADFKMNLGRHLFSLIYYLPFAIVAAFNPFALVGLLAIIAVNALPLVLQAEFTRFEVRRKAMYRRYKFLTAKETEFTNEKITGVVVKRNFIDYWFKTATIRFYSIGSASDLDFTHIDYDKDFVDKVLAKTGLLPEHKVFGIGSRFSFLESLRAGFFWVVGLAVLAVAWLIIAGRFLYSLGYEASLALAPLLVVGGAWLVVYVYQVFYYKRSRLAVYQDVVYFQKGIFFRDFYYARYDNIKDITTTRYPFSQEGDLKFNIAGEKVVQTQQGKSIQSHHFTIKYVPDIPVQDELVDFILLNRPQAEEIRRHLSAAKDHAQEPLLKKKPSLKNPLFITILLLLLPNLFVLFLVFSAAALNNAAALLFGAAVIFDALVLASVVIYTRAITYVVQDTRVLERWGVFYKKQTSVVFGKIDFLNNSQGMVNKIFKNGNITVNTIGSSRPEVTLKNLDDYQQFYKKLKEVYQG
jgi:membrane protein YdbS with pleckstrin-like domain